MANNKLDYFVRYNDSQNDWNEFSCRHQSVCRLVFIAYQQRKIARVFAF